MKPMSKNGSSTGSDGAGIVLATRTRPELKLCPMQFERSKHENAGMMT